MHLYEYQRSMSFIDLGPNLSDSIFLNFFSSITTGMIEAKFHQCQGVLLLWHIVGKGPAVLTAGAGWVGYVL